MGKGKLDVGIVGYGVVGHATGLVFPPDWIYDPAKGYATYDEDRVKNSVVFVCVSTLFRNGECDLDPVIESVRRFRNAAIIVIRSSVPPNTARGLSQYTADIVSNPEFLRETSASYDTMHPSKVVLGADRHKENLETLKQMYLHSNIDWSNCYGFIETDNTTAEMIKFVSNLLGACKISLANEVYDVCQKVKADFDAIRRAISTDSRLGNGFFHVTKQRGWGGRCFPKDMEIFLKWLEDNGVESKVLTAARDANLKYRKVGDES